MIPGMKLLNKIALLLLAVGLFACSPKEQTTPGAGASELDRLAEQAARIEIIRDDFGIPHVYGATDADAVFGMLYAQAEDDFPRVERNYIWAIGRLAEVDGLSLIHISEPTRQTIPSRMPSSA